MVRALDIDGLTVANIVGNVGEHFFAVRAWDGGRDGLLSTADAYDGTARIPKEALLLEVEAVGDWSISFE